MWKHAQCGYQNWMGKFERVFGFLFGWLVGFLVTKVAPRPSRLGDSFGKYRCLPPNQGALLFLWKVQGTRNSICVFFQQTSLGTYVVPGLHLVLEIQHKGDPAFGFAAPSTF